MTPNICCNCRNFPVELKWDLRLGKRLQSVIEFVAVHVSTHVLHEVVRPVVEHVTSVGCLVVLNQGQALFKNLGVQEGVERVAGDAEPGDAGTELTRVLLLG